METAFGRARFMNRSTAARAFAVAIALSTTAAPVFGGGYKGALIRSGTGAASAARMNAAPIARPNIVTRPMPPLHRAPGMGWHHGHHRGPVVFFVQPPYFGALPFGYSYSPYFPNYPYSSFRPYSSLYPYSWLGSFGTPPTSMAAPSTMTAPSTNADPYFCWVDGIGFTDEGRFLHHLHEVHGVPLDEGLASTELVGERHVFYGY
jgi:hypothetical protein